MRSGFAWAVALFAMSCGPSFEAVYEGNVRFEHCYRLDRDGRIASSHREYCWDQWIQAYTYGQPQDRVEYAKRRIRVLRGEPPPGLPRRAEVSPEATAVNEPAPEMPAPSAQPAALVAPQAPSKTSQELPGESCVSTCGETLAHCRKGCQTAPKGCDACEPEYGQCMRRCFE